MSILNDPSQPQYLLRLCCCFHFGRGPDACGKSKTDRRLLLANMEEMDHDISMDVDVEENVYLR